MSHMVALREVDHSYDKVTVLQNINLAIPTGEIFGLLGPSGSGKTTLVKIMVGILKPTKGEVYIEETPLPSLDIMQQIGFMAQSDALYQELTAYENLDFFAEMFGLSSGKRKKRISQVAEVVNLSNDLHKKVEHFSGGMKRRLSLAAALLHEPKLLMLDEPTVGIDPVLRQSIWQELRRLKEEGRTIVVTTHVMDEAERCDRLAMLRDGTILAIETPEKMKEMSQSATIEEAFLYFGGERV